MAEVEMATVIVRASDTRNGDDYSETMRVPGTLWREVGGKKGIEEAEKGLALWLRQRDPRWTPGLNVTFIRDEMTKQSAMKMAPPEVGRRLPAKV